MTLGGLVIIIIGVQDYILNTFDFVEFRIIIGVQDYILNTFDFVEFRIIIIIKIILLPHFCFHGFSKTSNQIALKLLVHTNKSNAHPW